MNRFLITFALTCATLALLTTPVARMKTLALAWAAAAPVLIVCGFFMALLVWGVLALFRRR
jgi:uncharacterized membrane protein